jgi:hypothetical protein
LHVLLHARVTRVLQTTSNVFRTVEFVQDLNGAHEGRFLLSWNLTIKQGNVSL